MGTRRHVPVARAACVSGADLAAMAVASQAAPRAPWWLPWMIASVGTLVLAVIFAAIWLADRRGLVRRPAASRQSAVTAGDVLRIEPGWPRSQWPRPIGTRTAIPGTAGDATTERK